jgi:hypothetical protein
MARRNWFRRTVSATNVDRAADDRGQAVLQGLKAAEVNEAALGRLLGQTSISR